MHVHVAIWREGQALYLGIILFAYPRDQIVEGTETRLAIRVVAIIKAAKESIKDFRITNPREFPNSLSRIGAPGENFGYSAKHFDSMNNVPNTRRA